MRIRELMTRDVQTVDPNTTVKETAEKMKELDIGSLPVCQGNRVVGMITDRDITLRVTAEAPRRSGVENNERRPFKRK